MKNAFLKTTGIVVCTLITAAYILLVISGLFDLPEKIILLNGEEKKYSISLPIDVTSGGGGETSVVKINGQSLNEAKSLRVSGGITLAAESTGDTSIDISIAGIPIRSIEVSSVKERMLIPGGIPVGVTLLTRGALIVGMSEITDQSGNTRNPARDAGIKAGDVILSIDGKDIEDSAQLLSMIEDLGSDALRITVSRNGSLQEYSVLPIKDAYDGAYRIGVWVRDSTAGVGTLTYYDPQNDTFAALGHAVTDIDTGKTLLVRSGEILKSNIVEIKKGYAGDPGELRGAFSILSEKLGSIRINNEFGIYGEAYESMSSVNRAVPVADMSEVEYGPAEILCTIDDKGVRPFDCEIVKINRQDYASPKSMIIKITDEELLQKTGGIVQGMSGSPILQHEKLVGAVTHVFLNSPDKGYGVFINWMLDISDKI